MGEPATTITPDGPSPSAEPTPSPADNRIIFVDDPDTPEPTPGAAVDTPASGTTDDDRFDKNSKFQERLKSMQEKEAKADQALQQYQKMMTDLTTQNTNSQRQIADLQKQLADLLKPKPKPDFDDITALEPDAFRERWDENPINSVNNIIAKIKHELGSTIPEKGTFAKEIARMVIGELSAASSKQSTENTVTSFMEKNKDFEKRIPEIREYMRKHPGHNEMSAYYELKAEDIEADVQKRVDEAIKKRDAEAIEKGAKDSKAAIGKGNRAPVKPSGPVTDEIINPEKHGTTSDSAILKMIKGMRGKGGK